MGIPLQSEPQSRNESNGLQYELDIGAFIGITGNEVTTRSSVRVGLGEFSGVSDEFQHQPGPVEIDMVFSHSEVWSDRPSITLALQVRDSQSLSTRYAEDEVVSVNVSHQLEADGITTDCNLGNSVSGVCQMSISLKNHTSWFSNSDETVVDVTTEFRGSSVTEQVTLRAKVAEDSSSNLLMKLPAHSVFPGEIIKIPVYARYEYLLSSYSFSCSVGEHASILGFTSSRTWSLLQTFPSDADRQVSASVTGFRNYDTDNVSRTDRSPDHLATLSVEIGNVSNVSEISVTCTAVDLLLTTMEAPDVDVLANATDRESLRIGKGLLFVQPITAVKLFSHTSINQVINIAALTGVRQTLNLTTQAFYTDGELKLLTDNLECSSDDGSVIKVESDCGTVLLSGSETNSGEATVTLQHNGTANGSVPFRVWLPTDTVIEVGNDTLRKIRTSCSDINPLYQKTHVHVVTSLMSVGEDSIDSVYITSAMLPYLGTNDSNVLKIDSTTGEVEGVRAGQAEITMPASTVTPRVVVVSDTDISVQYVDMFIFSDIQVNFISDTTAPVKFEFEVLLRQEFSYINSEINVVSVAVFEDGQRQVLDRDMVAIAAERSDTLVKMAENRYSIAEEVDRVAFDVSWLDDCIIAQGNGNIEFNASIPQSLDVRVNSSTIAHTDNPATRVGTPYVVKLEVLLVYEDGRTEDVTTNSNTVIDRDAFISIQYGLIELKEEVMIGVTTIGITFDGFEGISNLQNETTISVVRAEALIVSAHPFPPYDGSRNIPVNTIKKIGSSFQMVEIVARINLTDGSVHDINDQNELSIICQNDNSWLMVNVLMLPAEVSLTEVTIELMFVTLPATLVLGVEPNTRLEISFFSDIEFIDNVSLLNQYMVEFGITFEGGIYQNATSTADHNLVEFYANSSNDAINLSTINEDGLLQVVSNFHEPINICVRSTDQSVHLCEEFFANLQPQSGEIDLGNSTDLPVMSPVTVGSIFDVPVYLNLVSAPVGSFKMEVIFNNDVVKFMDITQGSDWESGQLVYVAPTGDHDRITFGGILHGGVSGARLNLAKLSFRSEGVDLANFSAKVSFIAQANVGATLLEEDRVQQVSESSRISVEVQTSRRRRDEDEYMTDEEPPLMSPTEFSRNSGVRRLRRQTGADCVPNSVVGDVNADCVVNLRDVYLLQLYVAESVFNFSSQSGQYLLNNYSETVLGDNSNMFTLSDIVELEIITLNLAYEVTNLSASVGYNTSIEGCMIEISGLLESVSGELPPTDINAHIIVGFLSTEPDFDGIFRNLSFIPPVEKSDFSNPQRYYGGSVKMMIKDPAAITELRLYGTVDSLSVGFNVTAAVVVTESDAAMGVLSFSSDVNNLEEALDLLELQTFPLADKNSILSDACERPIPATSSIATPSTTSVILNSPSSSISLPVLPSVAESSSVSQAPSTSLRPLPSRDVTPSSSVDTASSSAFSSSDAVFSSVEMPSTRTSTVLFSQTSSPPPQSSAQSTQVSSSLSSSLVQPSTSISTSVSASVSVDSVASSAILSSVRPSATAAAIPTAESADIATSRSSQPERTAVATEPSIRATTRVSSEQSTTVTSSVQSTSTPLEVPHVQSTTETPMASQTHPVATQATTSTASMPAVTAESEPEGSASLSVAGVVAGILSSVIILLVITLAVCGVYVVLRRKKGHYLLDNRNGVHIRRNSMVSNGSNSFWQHAENGIVSKPIECMSCMVCMFMV